jgi:hypothetical protein
MTAGQASPPITIGFLTVAEHPAGLFGGYLILNPLGRPVEFHCTTPVKPSRAQEILYGVTLAPYLCGELIAPMLVGKALHKPGLVLTDVEPVLTLRMHAAMPVAVVRTPAEEPLRRLDCAHDAPRPALATFRRGLNELGLDPLFLSDREPVLQRLQEVSENFDLLEPFGRIRAAICEAQRGAS